MMEAVKVSICPTEIFRFGVAVQKSRGCSGRERGVLSLTLIKFEFHVRYLNRLEI
jgi:hypothetical protein